VTPAAATAGTGPGPGPSAGRLFFTLALPLPSYALRHVLAAHSDVSTLVMRDDGASGWWG
jgi:hypothetical protein